MASEGDICELTDRREITLKAFYSTAQGRPVLRATLGWQRAGN